MIGSNVFGQAQQYQTQAGSAYGELSGFKPPAPISGAVVSSGGSYDPSSVTAGTLSGANYDQYMNPYTQQVIERGEQDIARQREQALNLLGAQATSAGAFGGSRFGLAEGETYGQYGRMAADMAAQQRQAAFQQAQQSAQFDINKQYEAQRADETARQQAFESAATRRLSASQQNAANTMAAQRQNQQAMMDAARMRQIGASGLSNLGSTMFGQGMRGLDQQQAAAARAQAAQQAMLDAGRQQTLANLGYPGQALQTGSGILSGLPRATMTQPGQPGLLGYLSALSGLPGFG